MNYELRYEAITVEITWFKISHPKIQICEEKKSVLKTENFIAGACYWQCHVIK